MLFNSHIFIFVFLPLCLLGWFLINRLKAHRIALLFLSGMSLWFYAYFNPSYLLIILASLLANYAVSFLLSCSFTGKNPAKSLVFLSGLAVNIGLLGYFKYRDFFVENFNLLFKTNLPLKNILLPLGISFFTLQQISYIADRYKGEAPHYAITEYLAYVTFFPQLIAGPIVLHSELVPQFRDPAKRKFDPVNFRDGVILFVLGLAKKVLIADFFAAFVNYGYLKIAYLDTLSAWAVAISYTLELYFDFSGYSDMAVGLARMFNFRIPGNFDSPYKALDPGDFWKRWHITLTRFLTNYIYIPLGGNRKGKVRTCINILLVFLISGFWHGASWTFVIWGLMHGLAMLWNRRSFLRIRNRFTARLFMFFFLNLTWAVFRSENLETMRLMLKALFTPAYNGFIRDIGSVLTTFPLVSGLLDKIIRLDYTLLYTLCAIGLFLFFFLAWLIINGRNSEEILALQKEKGTGSGFALILGILLVLCLVSMTGVSTFLYFNF